MTVPFPPFGRAVEIRQSRVYSVRVNARAIGCKGLRCQASLTIVVFSNGFRTLRLLQRSRAAFKGFRFPRSSRYFGQEKRTCLVQSVDLWRLFADWNCDECISFERPNLPLAGSLFLPVLRPEELRGHQGRARCKNRPLSPIPHQKTWKTRRESIKPSTFQNVLSLLVADFNATHMKVLTFRQVKHE